MELSFFLLFLLDNIHVEGSGSRSGFILWLMDPDLDPGRPKTYGSHGSGFATLLTSYKKIRKTGKLSRFMNNILYNRKMMVENRAKTQVWEDWSLCPETSTKNAVPRIPYPFSAGPITKHGDIDYEAVVKLSDGFNGADLRNVCTEAGLFAIR